jgi:exo-beta-1,3-glucanase (GH17 family)
MRYPAIPAAVAALVLAGTAAGGVAASLDTSPLREAAVDIRPFLHCDDGDRIGEAICYGPHRDGQRPGGPGPAAEQIREDLHLMRTRWRLLRTYGAAEHAETILATIRADSLDMKVMLGAWIEPERGDGDRGAPDAGKAGANERECAAAIRLANAYPDVVVAVCVGNETQVSWSGNRCSPAALIARIRQVRAAVSVPVTTADDFAYWREPASREVARELDFVTLHAHPLWNGRSLDEALPWLDDRLAEVRAAHPGATLALGEVGWATDRGTGGDQGRLIAGPADEASQTGFYRRYRAWVAAAGLASFWFEAFDENWKGGDDPHEVEKHWGLFRADRTPKPALTAE